ncbi:unnamed protein product [Protopolystoma xenopodis]|uniref:Uncharacterized protein n=1 Tax=Protopolystoma xenopodis TaxID=117903 RepID=A0A3S4ZNF2_9PLAT|nr:unnamed protein product [Protopolystoma xenopodis]
MLPKICSAEVDASSVNLREESISSEQLEYCQTGQQASQSVNVQHQSYNNAVYLDKPTSGIFDSVLSTSPAGDWDANQCDSTLLRLVASLLQGEKWVFHKISFYYLVFHI